MNTPPALPSQKPATVSTAIKLLYATYVVGAFRSVLEWSHQTQAASPGFDLFVVVFTFAIILWLTYKMDRGRNWARITFLILFILGVPFFVRPLLQSLSYSPVSGALGLLQVVLQTIALCKLFGSSARPWFRPAAASTPLQTPA